MFRAGLQLIIRMYYSVYTAVGIVMRYDDWLLAGSRSYLGVPEAVSLGVKRPWREALYSSVEVKNEWSCISAPSIRRCGYMRTNLSLPYFIV